MYQNYYEAPEADINMASVIKFIITAQTVLVSAAKVCSVLKCIAEDADMHYTTSLANSKNKKRMYSLAK